MPENVPWYAPGHQAAPRKRTPGDLAWTLEKGRQTASCELRDGTQAGAGVDVQLLHDGELVFSKRCPTIAGARFTAVAWWQDYLRAGYTTVDA